jgi:arylsulfatase A-like enzyme
MEDKAMNNRKPNIVIIMTDQQRADVSRREGFPLDTTPFLDQMAASGQWFDRAYTVSPLCVPARVSMLTGRFPSAHGIRGNNGVEHASYERDLFHVAADQGYKTALVGKNHSHITPDRVDHYFELSHNGGKGNNRTSGEKAFDDWLYNLTPRIGLEATPFPLECQGPYRAVSDAQGWLNSLEQEQPFLMWLSFAEPHNPYQVPEPYYSMFPPESLPPVRTGSEALKLKGFKWEWTKHLGEYVHPEYDEMIPRARANYFGMLRLIDDQIHRFVDDLESKGLLENTLLLFVSDHGDFVGEYGMVRKGPELPEPLVRIPMFVVGPGIKAGVGPNSAFVSLLDLMPTLCEVMGAPLPYGTQGRSLWPLLVGADYPAAEFDSIYAELGYGGLHYVEEDHPEEAPCLIPYPGGPTFNELNDINQSGTLRMLRMDRWKLVFDMMGKGQLYDLTVDPAELDNLFDHPPYAAVQSDMMKRLLAWTLRAQDTPPLPRLKYGRIKTDPRNYWANHNKGE